VLAVRAVELSRTNDPGSVFKNCFHMLVDEFSFTGFGIQVSLCRKKDKILAVRSRTSQLGWCW
ncbi:hypothetical protein, partial [Spirosoma flavum]